MRGHGRGDRGLKVEEGLGKEMGGGGGSGRRGRVGGDGWNGDASRGGGVRGRRGGGWVLGRGREG